MSIDYSNQDHLFEFNIKRTQELGLVVKNLVLSIYWKISFTLTNKPHHNIIFMSIMAFIHLSK